MKTPYILTCLSLSLTTICLITFSILSNAEQTAPVSDTLIQVDHSLHSTDQWIRQHIHSHYYDSQLKLSLGMILAAIFCFIAASISSAGGIGGGGLYIPILTIAAGLNLKTASSFSAFMVTGGSVANVVCYLFMIRSDKFGVKSLIDFDIAILSEPCLLLGVSVGVICNTVFPEWLITILFAVFLAWSTFKTCKNGVGVWRLESDVADRNDGCVDFEDRTVENASGSGSEEANSIKESLLDIKEDVNVKTELGFPWMNLGVLVVIWFSFSFLYLLRGNRYGHGIITIEPCGVVYWVLSSLQIPLSIIFTAWILLRKENHQCPTTEQHQDLEDSARVTVGSKLMFPIMALVAGILGGVFGIGGGMFISPLLLHVGIAPEVTAATCSFIVFFSSIMSAFQYLMLGMEHIDIALILSVICFFASLLGLLVVQKAIQTWGRASLIVFSVGTVMALSTVLMTSFGAIDVWREYKSGKNMGFKTPC